MKYNIHMYRSTDGLLPDSDPLSWFFNHAPDAILLIEPGSGGTSATIVACNPCACRLYGYAAEELVGQPVALLDAVNMAPVMDDAVAQAWAESAVRIEMVQNGKDGAYVEVDLSLTRVAHGDCERIITIARDITTSKRTERRLMVQHAISGVLAEANHFMDAAPRMLQIIGEYLGWELGSLWCVDYDAGVLRWTMGWHASGTAVADFEAESRARALQPGIGLPGEVWASGAPRWLGDLAAAASFSRHAGAAQAGLRSGFAFPIQGRGGVFGVMEFFSQGLWPADAELLAMAGAIGSQSGTFIERRRAEDAARFQAHLLDTVEQAVVATDLAGCITYWNRFAERLYGWSAAEAVGHNIANVTPASTMQEAGTTIMAHLRAGQSWSGEFLVQHRDGTIFPVQVTDSPVYDNQGRLVGIVGVSVDITARKRSEEQLQFLAEASSVLAGALDYETTMATLGRLAVPRLADWCSINLIDASDTFVHVAGRHVNPAKEVVLDDLRRQSPPSVSHLRVLLAASPHDGILVADVTDTNLADFAANADQLRVYREIGFRSAMIVPLRAGERLLGAIILATDESGRQYGPDDFALATDLASRAALAIENTRLYQDAQAAIRTRDDFLSIAAHELKTPVTGMVGYSQLLQRRVEQEAMLSVRDRRALGVINEQAKRLAALVGTLLDVSRIETGHFTLDCEPVDLCALVQQVVEEIQPTLEQHTLTYSCPGIPLRIDGDAMRLEQVLQNLVQNAVKYSPDGSPIMVRVEQQGDQATIAVSDRGIGIPPDAQAHLFERFFRAPNVGRSSIGVGIGLYVVKQIVDRHNGTIEVESVEGLGSTFTVRLPLA